MIKFSILTLFPDVIEASASRSILGRAQKNKIIMLNTVDLRSFLMEEDSDDESNDYRILSTDLVKAAYQRLTPLH